MHLDQLPFEPLTRQSRENRYRDRQSPITFCEFSMSRSVMHASNSIDVIVSGGCFPGLVLRTWPTCSASPEISIIFTIYEGHCRPLLCFVGFELRYVDEVCCNAMRLRSSARLLSSV